MGSRWILEEYVAYKNWLKKNVGVSRYSGKLLVMMCNKKATGFSGIVLYDVKDEENAMEQNYSYACTLWRVR
jgi:hypothetical protein